MGLGGGGGGGGGGGVSAWFVWSVWERACPAMIISEREDGGGGLSISGQPCRPDLRHRQPADEVPRHPPIP